MFLIDSKSKALDDTYRFKESREKDKIKHEMMKSQTKVGYIKIINKNYDEFLQLIHKEGDK